MMRNLKLKCNTLYVTKSEPEFPMKGFRTTPQNFSKLKVEVLYEALLAQHKCGHTQTISNIRICVLANLMTNDAKFKTQLQHAICNPRV